MKTLLVLILTLSSLTSFADAMDDGSLDGSYDGSSEGMDALTAYEYASTTHYACYGMMCYSFDEKNHPVSVTGDTNCGPNKYVNWGATCRRQSACGRDLGATSKSNCN